MPAIDEVVNWGTATADNLAHHPVGPQGRDAARISKSFREMQAAIARWRDSLGAGGSIGGTIADDQIAVGAATPDEIEGTSALTFDGRKVLISSTPDPIIEFNDTAVTANLRRWYVGMDGAFVLTAVSDDLLTERDALQVNKNASQQITSMAFNSNSVTFNAGGGSGTGVTIPGHSLLILGPNSGNEFVIHRPGTSGSLRISGGSATLGSSIKFFGNSGSQAQDMYFEGSNNARWMEWDNSLGRLRIKTGTASSKPVAVDFLNNQDSQFYGTVISPAATTALASMRLPHGVAPTTPVDGDFWTTTSSAFIQINGTTQDLLAGGGGGAFTRDGTDGTIYSDTYTGSAGLINQNFLALDQAGDSLTTGARNILIGYQAGTALSNSGDNIAIGYQSMLVAASGAPSPAQNVMIGSSTGARVTTGSNNVCIGMETGRTITTGTNNTLIGSRTAQDISIALTGTNNTIIGADSADDLGAGVNNTIIGAATTRLLDSGDGNVGVGHFCLDALQFGDNNTALGKSAGRFWVSTSSRNVAIGFDAGPPSTTTENDMLYINNAASTTPLIKGDFANDTVTINGDLTVTGSFVHGSADELVFAERADHVSTPTAGEGYLWLRNDTPNNLIFTDDAGTDHVIGGGLSGTWVVLDDTTITGSPTEHKITWDESAYSDIIVIIKGIQSATDLLDLRCTLGEANGATMHETSGDYAGSYGTNFATTRTALSGADIATPQIANNTGNQSGETISGIIHIKGGGGGKGAVYQSVMHYVNNAGNRETLDTNAMLTTAAAANAVDTYRLHYATAAAFANVGSIRTIGLRI